jgi:peptide/nickel transport system substrate-binding protein
MVVWGRADVLSLARREVTGIQAGLSAKYPYLGKAGLA